ncbi:hypothetical protein ACWDSJ_22520 [Nocardia sp. NPDC003482]
MSYIELGRRVTKLEGRVTDIEESHGASIYRLERRSIRSELIESQLVDGVNYLQAGMARILQHFGLPPIPFSPIAMPTEDEIDAVLEDQT